MATKPTPTPVEISPETKDLLKKILSKIKKDYTENTVSPQTLFEFLFHLQNLKNSEIK